MKAPSWNQTVLLVSSDLEVKNQLSTSFGSETTFLVSNDTQEAIEAINAQTINVLILDAKTTDPTKSFYDEIYQEKNEIPYIELSQYANQINNGVTIILLVDKIQLKDSDFARKCGAVLITDRKDININQIIYLIGILRKRTFRTVLAKDLTILQSLPVDLYHYLPMSDRYALFLPANTILTHDKLYKVIESNVRHVYVKEQDLSFLLSALRLQNKDLFSDHLSSIRNQYKQLLVEIFDLSTDGKLHIGKKIQETLYKISEQIEALVKRFPDPIECINELPYPRFSVIAHSINSGIYAYLFARACDFKNIHDIVFAAMIHNLGFYNIDQKILKKSEKEMTKIEFEEYKKHIQYTIELLKRKSIPLPEKTEELIENHHENYDGTGFPQALAGETLSIESSLISLLSSYDYYKSARPNERVLDAKKAWEKVLLDQKNATPLGKKYHPDLILRLESTIFKK